MPGNKTDHVVVVTGGVGQPGSVLRQVENLFRAKAKKNIMSHQKKMRKCLNKNFVKSEIVLQIKKGVDFLKIIMISEERGTCGTRQHRNILIWVS